MKKFVLNFIKIILICLFSIEFAIALLATLLGDGNKGLFDILSL